jgi:hypothetical protein
MWITEPEPHRPDLVLWLQMPDELVIKGLVLDPQQPETFSQTFLDATRAPMVGPPRRPRRIRVADAALAAELRAAIGDLIPVTVAPTPEIDRVVQIMAQTLPKDGEAPGYLEGGHVSEASVESLFGAARMLYHAAPWKTAADSQVVRIDVPALGIRGACMSVIGALGESLGFILFPSLQAFDSFAELGENVPPEGEPLDFGAGHLALTFDHIDDVAPEMQREIAEHGWEVAGPAAYPCVEQRERDGMLRPLGDDDVRLAAALAAGLATFSLRNRAVFADDFHEPVSVTYDGIADLAVRFTAPYEAFDLFEDSKPIAEESPVPRVGRNAPCPCGSGKKYKKCHLGKDEKLQTAPTSAPESAHELGGRLARDMFDQTARRLSRQWIPFVQRHGLGDLPPEFVLPWLLHEVPWDGRTIAARYRDSAGPRLSDRERAWLEGEATAWLSIWEVTQVDAGTGVTVHDLLTGAHRSVTEHEGSKTLKPRDAVLGRVVDFEGQSFFDGLYPRSLPPFEAAEVVRRVRGRVRRRREVPAERLRDPKVGPYMIGYWMDEVEDLLERRSTPPQLANMDGDDLLFTVDHFELDAAARSEVEKRLSALEGAERSTDEQGKTLVRFVRTGRQRPDQITAGWARLSKRGLELETNSVRRADELRRQVEDACGDLVRHRIREHADPRSGMKRGEAPAKKPARVEGPDADRFIREHKERHYAAWLDESIPALNGCTPREAMQTRDGRERLDVLLKDLENMESRMPEGQRFDVGILHRALGL